MPLVQRSFSECNFPSQWKQPKVKYLAKKGGHPRQWKLQTYFPSQYSRQTIWKYSFSNSVIIAQARTSQVQTPFPFLGRLVENSWSVAIALIDWKFLSQYQTMVPYTIWTPQNLRSFEPTSVVLGRIQKIQKVPSPTPSPHPPEWKVHFSGLAA